MPQYVVKINNYCSDSTSLSQAQELAKVLAGQSSPEPAYVYRDGAEFCRYEFPVCPVCDGGGHAKLITTFAAVNGQ